MFLTRPKHWAHLDWASTWLQWILKIKILICNVLYPFCSCFCVFPVRGGSLFGLFHLQCEAWGPTLILCNVVSLLSSTQRFYVWPLFPFSVTENTHKHTEGSSGVITDSLLWWVFPVALALLPGTSTPETKTKTCPMAAMEPKNKCAHTQVTHIAGQHFHCGVVELISTGLDVSTAKQVPTVKKTVLLSWAMLWWSGLSGLTYMCKILSWNCIISLADVSHHLPISFLNGCFLQNVITVD